MVSLLRQFKIFFVFILFYRSRNYKNLRIKNIENQMVFCQNIMKKSYISILKYSSTNFFLIKIKLQDQLIQKQQQKIKKRAADLHILFFLINLFFFSYARVELEHIVTSSFWSLNMAGNST